MVLLFSWKVYNWTQEASIAGIEWREEFYYLSSFCIMASNIYFMLQTFDVTIFRIDFACSFLPLYHSSEVNVGRGHWLRLNNLEISTRLRSNNLKKITSCSPPCAFEVNITFYFQTSNQKSMVNFQIHAMKIPFSNRFPQCLPLYL